MKKSRARETHREEAERLDALEETAGLDHLPFTRLRRYAKEPSQVYAIRIPVTRLKAIRGLADRRSEQPTALLREWVLERLDEELARTEPTRAGETPPDYLIDAEQRRKRAPSPAKRVARKVTKKPSGKSAGAKKRS